MDVTIFIRAKNEAKFIKPCLEVIFSQKTSLSYEVILLDSESTDDTVEQASAFNLKIYTIPGSLFHYSTALNYGVFLSEAKYFVSLSAHAVPVDQNWLKNLTAPMIQNIKISGVFSRQIPWPEISSFEAAAISRAFPPQSYILTPSEYNSITKNGVEPFEAGKFSNVSSCIRCSELKKFPYRMVPFAEDRCFAAEALAAGFSIAYAADSVVYHSHKPRFKDFRIVAKNATIARRAINHLIRNDTTEVDHAKRLRSLVRLLGYLILLPIKLLLSLNNPAKMRFLICSIGTSVGKLEGTGPIRPDLLLAYADPAQIQSAARQIK